MHADLLEIHGRLRALAERQANEIVYLRKFEEAAKEFAKGCSCAPKGTPPMNCSECTAAYLQHVLYLVSTHGATDCSIVGDGYCRTHKQDMRLCDEAIKRSRIAGDVTE